MKSNLTTAQTIGLSCFLFLFSINFLFAQTFKLVGTGKYEGGSVYALDADGTNPEMWVDFTVGHRASYTNLLFLEGKFYGMTREGGTHNAGIIFSVNPDGTDYQKMYNFNITDGRYPEGTLVYSNNKFWGTTSDGGDYNQGVIFNINSDGTGYTKVHSFGNTGDGWPSYGSLILYGNELWGTTFQGGADGNGTIYKLNSDGTGYTTVHNFDHTNGLGRGTPGSNNLLEYNGKFYGMGYGGSYDHGIIFSINADGTGFTKLHDFNGTDEGGEPYGSLIEVDGFLFGMTCNFGAGSQDEGKIFKYEVSTGTYTVLHTFYDNDGNGDTPFGDLVEYNGWLYGMASGLTGLTMGTVFRISPNGQNFEVLKKFTANSYDGGHSPWGSLIFYDDKLWGLTSQGASQNRGSIFSITPDGSSFDIIHEFDYDKGFWPSGRMTESNEKLWGATAELGNLPSRIFTTNIDGTGFEIVHIFSFESGGDGGEPSPLFAIGDKVWGMCKTRGQGYGTIFYMNNDGSGFTKVHDFDSDNGQAPYGTLMESGGKLWGMTYQGGAYGEGVIFTINLDGTGYTVVHNFDDTNGANPYGELFESGGKLWGLTHNGGTQDRGVIFSINTDGTGFTMVHEINSLNNMSGPNGSFIEANGKLWATIENGGILSMNTDGTGLTLEHSIVNGELLYGNLLHFNNKLWGVTYASKAGTIFTLDDDGTNYTEVRQMDPSFGAQLFYAYGAALTAVDQNHRPTYSDIPTQEYKEDDTGKQIKLTDYFDDIEDGPSGLIYSIENVTEPSLFSTTPISSGTMTLNLAANQFGSTEMTIRGTDTGGKFIEGTFIINIAPVADNPSITMASTNYGVITTSGLKASRNAVDGNEVTHVRITDITNGTLYLSNGSTKVNNNAFVTFSNAINGFKFIPNEVGTATFNIQASTGNTVNGLGGSKIQASITVDKKTLTATANNKSRKYGAANPAFTITYTGFVFGETPTVLNTPPIASTGAVPISNVASYTISLSAGSDDHYEIVENDGILTVSKATVTATANNKTKKYREPNPAFTITYSGFVNAESASALDVAPIATSAATTNSNAGNYPITLSTGTDGNYEVLLVNGTLNITQRMLSATADNKTKVYGQNNPTLTISYSGFLSGENVDDLEVPPVASTIASATSDVGNYPIVLSAGTDINYLIETTDGILSITKASLTAIADNKSKMYGAPIPLLTVSYEGFLNGDSPALIDNQPIPSTSANELSSKGSYTISLSAGSDTNYIISTVNGTLTITKAYLVATADDKTKVYGESNPELTISYEGFAQGEDATVLDNAPVVSTAVLENTFVGEYPISITSGMDDNYDIEVQPGTFTVEKASLMATIDNATKVYGDINPEFVIHYSGFQFDDNELSLDNSLVPNTSADETSDVGVYSITIDETSDTNYIFEVTDGILTINKASLNAIAENKSRSYNQENPELTIKFEGFVNGDSSTDLDEIPSTTTDAKLESDVGTYDISLSGGNDNNYTIELTNGLLTIEKADQVITFNELPDVSIKAGSIILEASSSSGLPVSFSSEDNAIATISGDVASLVGLGEVVITANQEGNSNYNPAQSISRTLTIAEITGFKDEGLITLNIYPNPANDYFTIDMENSPIGNIRMISQEGKIIKEFVYRENAEYDIRFFTNGLYFVMIETEEKNAVIKKILIEKK